MLPLKVTSGGTPFGGVNVQIYGEKGRNWALVSLTITWKVTKDTTEDTISRK